MIELGNRLYRIEDDLAEMKMDESKVGCQSEYGERGVRRFEANLAKQVEFTAFYAKWALEKAEVIVTESPESGREVLSIAA